MIKNIAACLLVAVPVFAAAQTTTDPDRVMVPGSASHMLSIDVPAKPLRLDRDDFDRYRGAYDLSNGQTLQVFRDGLRMYAEVDQLGRHQIVASARNAFVALDKKMKMRIDLRDDGSVGGELVMMVPAANLAGVAGVAGLPGPERLVRLSFP